MKVKLLPVFGLLVMAGCQPPRSPVIKRPLEIEGAPKPIVTVPSAPGSDAQDVVRIGIRVEAKEASVTCLGSIEAIDLVTKRKEIWPPGKYMFSADSGKLLFEGHEKGSKWRLRPEEGNKYLQTADKSYRGEFVVRVAGSDKVTITNELSIDDYLKGVLPREASASWSQHALRAQAVASRTYLASHLGSHSQQGFDLCSDVHCQVYGGMNKEHPNTNDAVDATQGQILTYEEKPIGAFFHSHCGGTTEQIEPVWGASNRPYLPRKRCPYCKDNPRYHWSLSLNSSDILTTLRAKTKVTGQTLKSIRIKQKSGSGRAAYITVTTDKGSYTLRGNEFRIALHPEKIRSTLLTTLERHGNGYKFAGRGWGHGVGMCQWGAKGQSDLGRDYRDILEFYYPHTVLRTWNR